MRVSNERARVDAELSRLSDAEMAVVALLRDGWLVYVTTTGQRITLRRGDSEVRFVSRVTLQKLHQRGIITRTTHALEYPTRYRLVTAAQ